MIPLTAQIAALYWFGSDKESSKLRPIVRVPARAMPDPIFLGNEGTK